MLAAGDTFRAAAVEQLQVWGEPQSGACGCSAYRRRQCLSNLRWNSGGKISRAVDVVIADTAGRLHNKSNLMEELKKVKRGCWQTG